MRNKWKKVIPKKSVIETILNEPHKPQQNDAEQETKIIKRKTLQRMMNDNITAWIRYFTIIHEAKGRR